MAWAVVGDCTNCMKLKVAISLTIAEFWCCKKSSLKSPSITQGVLNCDTCVNNLDSTVVKLASDTLYTTAICILPALRTCTVADTASMPVVANLCVLDGFIWLGTQMQNSTFVFTCYSVTSNVNLVM